MFTSSGGIGIPLCAEQQYLYDISYDDDWGLCKHEDEGSCFIHVSPSSMGLPERHFICDIPQLTPVFPTNASSSSAEPVVAHSFLHTHRKKPLKKDRHSKILTAQGTRDRRMRLSLDIAKQFFYLQDLLGFDKASKTVEWLLNQSEASIKELEKIKSKGSPQNSEKSDPTSDGEVASGIEDIILENNSKEIEKPSPVFKEKKMSLCRKRIFDPLARESRAKARQWAKQRTWLKKNFDESNKLTSANALETADGIGSHSMESFSSIYNFDYNENIQISQRMNSENLSSNQTSSYLNPNYHLSSETSQDRLLSFPFSPTSTTHFTDLPLCSKPWEVFSN